MTGELKKILNMYPALKLTCLLKRKEIELPTRRRSKDIIFWNSSGNPPETEESKLQRRINSIERTEREVKRIEKALMVIRGDKYYEIIELAYFGVAIVGDRQELYTWWITNMLDTECSVVKLDNVEIAEYFGVGHTCLEKNKARLLNILDQEIFYPNLI